MNAKSSATFRWLTAKLLVKWEQRASREAGTTWPKRESRHINMLEQILVGEVMQLRRDLLLKPRPGAAGLFAAATPSAFRLSPVGAWDLDVQPPI